MLRFQLVLQNPTLADLCARFPHLRRFQRAGFECDRLAHRDNEVGLYNRLTGQSLTVALTQ